MSQYRQPNTHAHCRGSCATTDPWPPQTCVRKFRSSLTSLLLTRRISLLRLQLDHCFLAYRESVVGAAT